MTRSADGGLILALHGRWNRSAGLAAGENAIVQATASPLPSRIVVTAEGLSGWDSLLVAFLLRLRERAEAARVPLDLTSLPMGVQRLVNLASAVPEQPGAPPAPPEPPLARLGRWAVSRAIGWGRAVDFLGQLVLALAAFARGRAAWRREDFVMTLQEAGPQALGIVGTINLLIGLILAFIGAVQLAQFGAAIYVADLVGLAMTREMAAVMTAIVIAGRTGAAFAAQLGTMQGNEEIDALSTLGLAPVQFLVLPRLLALVLMMPLLYIYGCALGLFGGYLVAIGMLDVGGQAYLDRTREAVDVADFLIGLVKSVIFGMVVAMAGCQRGIQAGRSAAAVGLAATSAVVSAIVQIIVIDAIFAVALNILKL